MVVRRFEQSFATWKHESVSPPEFDEDWIQAALERYSSNRSVELRDQIQGRADWLATRSAWRFVDSGELFDDLVQVARLALFKAIERYDHTRGVPFGAFATPTILGELKRHFRDNTWSVHVPRRAKDLRPALNLVVQELSSELCRPPKVSEIAHRMQVSEEAVLEAMDANNAYRAASLDPTRAGHVATAEDESGDVVNKGLVAQLLGKLPPRERNVVYLRFYEELSQAQIAERIGTSQVHVGRILAASFARLRELVDDADTCGMPEDEQRKA